MPAGPSIVRAAVPADEAELWALMRLMHHETGLCPLSEAKVQSFLDRTLRPEAVPPEDVGPRGIIGVIGMSRLEAAIMLVLNSIWYSDEIIMMDALNFVHPNYRQSNHAKTLISYAKHMVDEIRKTHVDFKMMMGLVSTKRTEAKIRLFRRQLPEAGAVFVYPSPEGIEHHG